MADHEHGTMDIEEQEKTFSGFVTFCIRSVIVIFFILLFLAVFNS